MSFVNVDKYPPIVWFLRVSRLVQVGRSLTAGRYRIFCVGNSDVMGSARRTGFAGVFTSVWGIMKRMAGAESVLCSVGVLLSGQKVSPLGMQTVQTPRSSVQGFGRDPVSNTVRDMTSLVDVSFSPCAILSLNLGLRLIIFHVTNTMLFSGFVSEERGQC